MRSSYRVVGVLIAGILAGCGLSIAEPMGDDCDFEAPFEESADAAGAAVIRIDAGAGSLQVVGNSGLSAVRVRGKGCASSQRLLDGIELTVQRRGDRIDVIVDIPDRRWGNSNARLDLEIEVPGDVPIEIDDGSGAMKVRGVAAAAIADGSGSIEVRDVAGDLRIDDGSGSVHVEDVGGEVHIRDGSGEIEVRRAGSVVIDEDGSGSIEIAEVEGDVVVRDDGSGSIYVSDVGGDFTVRDDSSGGIRHRDVGGHVSVPADD
ncbi:MAG: hypothetical protein V3T72_04625 [Thermoanaerobaculia bacterium]